MKIRVLNTVFLFFCHTGYELGDFLGLHINIVDLLFQIALILVLKPNPFIEVKNGCETKNIEQMHYMRKNYQGNRCPPCEENQQLNDDVFEVSFLPSTPDNELTMKDLCPEEETCSCCFRISTIF